jgi:hypothetical protein
MATRLADFIEKNGGERSLVREVEVFVAYRAFDGKRVDYNYRLHGKRLKTTTMVAEALGMKAPFTPLAPRKRSPKPAASDASEKTKTPATPIAPPAAFLLPPPTPSTPHYSRNHRVLVPPLLAYANSIKTKRFEEEHDNDCCVCGDGGELMCVPPNILQKPRDFKR